MHAIVIKGPAARLQWGYHEAASLSSWSVTPDPSGGGTLTATVVQMDTFRASQQPLTFVVPRAGANTWTWAVHSLQVTDDGRLTAVLGPQES